MSGEGTYVCTLDEATQKKAREELNEIPQERASQIETLRQWVKAQPHLKCRTDDEFLLRFLRVSKFSQLRAQEKLDNFLTVRCSPTKGVPEWFSSLSPKDPKLVPLIESGMAVPLPGTDDQGRRVVLVRTGHYDPKQVDYANVMRLSFLNGDCMLLDEPYQVNGVQVILDFGEFSTSHATGFSRDLLAKCMKCWNDVYPTRNKGTNYFNTTALLNPFFEFGKLFMKEKQKARMHFHKDSLESLHKQVPKRMLPTEYGGDAGLINDLALKWKEELLKCMDEYDLNEKTLGIDESKRPVKNDQQAGGWGLVGSFRKLNV